MKERIQEGIDRSLQGALSLPARAAAPVPGLNTDLDLGRIAERLIEGTRAALGVSSMGFCSPTSEAPFDLPIDRVPAGGRGCAAPVQSALVEKLAQGDPVNVRRLGESFPGSRPLDFASYSLARAKGELIALLGVGRKEGLDRSTRGDGPAPGPRGPGRHRFHERRLLRSLREKADELQR